MSEETATNDAAWTRITTKAEYMTKCADVYFGDEGGTSIATSDGKIMGNFGGQELSGTWDWTGEYFSRTSTLGDMDLGYDEIVIDVTETQMRLTLQKGDGPQVVYDRKGVAKNKLASSDDITILSTFDIKPEGIDRYIAAMVENQKAVRGESGNLEMRMFQDVNNPSAFFIFGRTDGQAGLESHEEEVEDRGIAEEVAPTLSEPPVTNYLGQVSTGAAYGDRERPIGDEELIVFAIFDFKPGYRDKVLALYEKQVPLVRAAETSILFNVFTIADQDDKLVVYERWTSPAAGQEFATTRPVSIETGKMLAEGVKGELGDYLHTVTEIAPY